MIIPTISDSTILNTYGIVLEIAGFIVILFAVKRVHSCKGDGVSEYSKYPELMSTVHPLLNKEGISLVIAGLSCQGIAAFVRS